MAINIDSALCTFFSSSNLSNILHLLMSLLIMYFHYLFYIGVGCCCSTISMSVCFLFLFCVLQCTNEDIFSFLISSQCWMLLHYDFSGHQSPVSLWCTITGNGLGGWMALPWRLTFHCDILITRTLWPSSVETDTQTHQIISLEKNADLSHSPDSVLTRTIKYLPCMRDRFAMLSLYINAIDLRIHMLKWILWMLLNLSSYPHILLLEHIIVRLA